MTLWAVTLPPPRDPRTGLHPAMAARERAWATRSLFPRARPRGPLCLSCRGSKKEQNTEGVGAGLLPSWGQLMEVASHPQTLAHPIGKARRSAHQAPVGFLEVEKCPQGRWNLGEAPMDKEQGSLGMRRGRCRKQGGETWPRAGLPSLLVFQKTCPCTVSSAEDPACEVGSAWQEDEQLEP